MVGKEIQRIELLGLTTRIDLNNLSSGKYLVELIQDENNVTTIIVVQ